MTSVMLIIQFVLAAALTIIVLLQKSSSIGLGAYSGSNESVFGAKGPAGFMTKFTFSLAFAFIINTLALGYFYNQEKKGTLVDKIDTNSLVPSAPVETSTAPVSPTAPAVSKEKVVPAEKALPTEKSVPTETTVPTAPAETK